MPPHAFASSEPRERAAIAAIGDSITRGTNSFGWYGDHPSVSWSTGFNPLDGLTSHYERLLRLGLPGWPDELNVAEAGATMAAGPGQAERVVERGADYVTILLGANDLCARSPEEMTRLGEFRADFETTLATLSSGLPEARIFVASIPNLYRLWWIFRDRSMASFVWRSGRICPSMLDPANTADDRVHVFVRELAFNYVLADVCLQHPSCVFDDYAVFRHPITPDEVSTLDFFHPSLEGQDRLASLTWDAAWPS